MALSCCTQYPPPFCNTVYLLLCWKNSGCAESADSEALGGLACAISTARERGERQKRAQQTEKKRKEKKHTRPVMQKHRFNVRLGSVISSGERKKLVWTGRKREMEIRRRGSRASSRGLRDAGDPADGAPQRSS